MDTRLSLLILLLGVSLCFAASGVLRQKKSALRRDAKLYKREAPLEADLCDKIVDGIVPDWMTVCDENEKKGTKQCIFSDWLCDGETDCKDKSDEDETLCANTDPDADLCAKIDKNGVVPYWMRVCQDSATCIFADWVCDDEADCFDGSDETGDVCEDIDVVVDLCAYADFDGSEEWLKVCDSGDECILTDFMCDKEEDCKDGSDEHPKVCKDIWKSLGGEYRTLG